MKKINIINLMYNLYLFLFIFTMINREFLFFGLDLRYILLIVGFVLIYLKLLNINRYGKTIKKDQNFGILALFYLWAIVCNISWFWNGLNLETGKFINQIILIVNSFISLIVLYLYKEHINYQKVYKMIIFSCIVLLISFVFVSMGYELSQISGSDVRSIARVSEAAKDNKNLFGGNYRIAGYAEDPNYASMFWVIGLIAIMKSKIKKFYKIVFALAFFICFGFACSKTILVSCLLGTIVIGIIKFLKLNKKSIKIMNVTILAMIIVISIIIPKITSIHKYMPSTLVTRFGMWNLASDLFEKSPVVGNGIDSFKSYINEKNNGTWYVQCHNTYWQILSELGIIGLILFVKLLLDLLNKTSKDYLNYFLLFIYIIYAATYETIAMQFVIAILYLMPMSTIKEEEE